MLACATAVQTTVSRISCLYCGLVASAVTTSFSNDSLELQGRITECLTDFELMETLITTNGFLQAPVWFNGSRSVSWSGESRKQTMEAPQTTNQVSHSDRYSFTSSVILSSPSDVCPLLF